ncbi:MAG: response regulator, partial [Gammaproteobacteria bacterium]|nr:response regulator [Gammaproteobacteria bacterium]
MNTVPRILVVDDEAAFCELCAGWLAAAGYQVESAGTLADAQSTLVSFDADLVLLDLSMPPSYDPADTLAQMARLGTRPIIVLTGHAQRELALQATARGAWDFLAKPVDPELLAVVIRRALAQRHLTQALQRLQ